MCASLSPLPVSKAWHVKAHSVLAGMVLATEYVHGSSHAPGERHALRLEILEVVDLLRAGVASSGGGSDTILPRGIGLILHLIGEPSAGVSGVDSEVTSPSLATLAEISNELPVEHLWPAFDQLEGLDSGWLNPALVGGAEPELWNPDGSFNWEGTMNWDWTAASGLGGSMLG